MTDMSDDKTAKQRVLERWPDAYTTHEEDGLVTIWTPRDNDLPPQRLGVGEGSLRAWASAAERLERT